MAVSTRRKPMTNVDANLEAASAPIALEPEAGGIEGRHAARMAELVRQGVPRQQAMEIAGREVIQAQSAEADARADARVQSGYRDPRQTAYNAETFADGYGFDDSNQPAYLGQVDIDNMGAQELSAKAARAYNARDPRGAEVAISDLPHPGRQVQADPPRALGMTAPGPRTLDGRPPAPSRSLMTPEDVEAYDVRPPNGLSQRDRDMALRGMVPVVTPNGVSYMRAAGDTQTIGGPGRAGSRPDLLTKEDPEQQWVVSERGDYIGPDGKPVSVLVPGPQMREKQATDLQGRQFAYKAKKAAMEERLQKSRDLFAATAILAGGSQNINAGNRGIYNQAAGIEDKGKQAEFLSQFRQGSRGFQSNDPRIQVAQINAEAQKEAAAAEREGRIGAEERAAAARAHDLRMQREFDAEQKGLDRELAGSQGDATREQAAAARQADLEERRMQHEALMARGDQQFQQATQESAARAAAEERRFTVQMESAAAEREAARAAMESRERQHQSEMGLKGSELDDSRKKTADAMAMLERDKNLAPLVAQYGEGVQHIASGDYGTPQAQDSLRKLAKQSDESWFGFGLNDAVRMEAILQRLGVNDPDARSQMIERFGYEPSNNFLGMGGDGRGERLSYWFSGRPR